MAIDDGTLTEPQEANEKTNEAAGVDDSTVDPADAELVKVWLERIKKSKKAHERAFKQMRDNEYLATHGADKEWIAGKNYTVAIVNRHINQAVAALYARNPVCEAKPRKKMRYTVWDGRQDTLQAALQMAAQGDPNAVAIIQDIMQARAQEEQVHKTGHTLEILWDYFTSQQSSDFQKQFKALVRRVKVVSVGWVKICFQRALEPRPEIAAQIEDATSQLATTERLLKENAAGDIEAESAKAAELKSLIEMLQTQLQMVVREGPVYDFPKATRVIVDRDCTHLKTLAGARWLAQQFDLDDDQVMEIYEVDLKKSGGASTGETEEQIDDASMSDFDKTDRPRKTSRPMRKVYEIQDKRDGQFLTVCEGHDGFLKRPEAPETPISRFFTLFPLVFNEIESEDELYPPSDVELLADTAKEYNRSRQALREHRHANRPKYAAAAGALTDEDKRMLQAHPANAVLELASLKMDGDVGKLVQRFPMIGIDPNQYDTKDFFSDIERIVGTQQANLGTGSNTTATETSIVEQGRQAGLSDALDDLDDVLSDLAQATGELLFQEMSVEMVKQIVGPGAVWPDAPPSRQDISENLYLDIKAGSSGRPNRAVELANIERAVPLFLQIPGTKLDALRDKAASLLDLDPVALIADGAPSITAMNAIMVKMQQQPANALPGQAPAGPGIPPHGAGGPQPPGAQGPQGALNAPAVHGIAPGPQPGMNAQQLPA